MSYIDRYGIEVEAPTGELSCNIGAGDKGLGQRWTTSMREGEMVPHASHWPWYHASEKAVAAVIAAVEYGFMGFRAEV